MHVLVTAAVVVEADYDAAATLTELRRTSEVKEPTKRTRDRIQFKPASTTCKRCGDAFRDPQLCMVLSSDQVAEKWPGPNSR